MAERRTIPLDDVRADGWFERLGENSPNFAQLCDVMGEQFVAFAVIAGVRIRALTVDRGAISASVVEFSVGDGDDVQQATLGDLQRRLCVALLSADEAPEGHVSANPTSAELRDMIGYRYVLLSPVFGVTLKALHVDGGKAPSVEIAVGDFTEELEVGSLREAIRARLRNELIALQNSQAAAVDVEVMKKAVEAGQRRDFQSVLGLMGPWVAPLSMMLRSPQGQNVDTSTRLAVVGALGFFAESLLELNQDHGGAEDVLRLAIQWAQRGDGAGRLFFLLGRVHVERNEMGQAIGALRRSLSLDGRRTDVLPLLARCYADRKRWVACALCAEEAQSLGVADEALSALQAEAAGALGPAWAS
ncbi:MAG: hypothetical protein KC416_09255, partial [Myxococcales bacterium]|nr:hypothetical protein [Myxococcales bacterium]